MKITRFISPTCNCPQRIANYGTYIYVHGSTNYNGIGNIQQDTSKEM